MEGINVVMIIAIFLFVRLGIRLYKNYPKSNDENDTP